MSEIVRFEDPPMIRFGKHAGKSAAEVMATDPAYVQWALAQPWFQEKNPTLVQFFVTGSVAGLGNNAAEPAETPEHNALQAKFTQDAYCLAAAAMFSAGQKIRSAAEVQQESDALAGSALADHFTVTHPQITDRCFELNAWDVQFTFTGAHALMNDMPEPTCSCTPMPVPEVPSQREVPEDAGADERGRACEEYRNAREISWEVEKVNRHREVSRFTPSMTAGYSWDTEQIFKAYAAATHHEMVCPRSSQAYFLTWSMRDREFVPGARKSFGLELKPSIGDDFPAVLRQVLGYLKRPGLMMHKILAAVVVGEFRSASVPWHLVKKQFWESGVLLVQEAELDALVEQHAHEWGIDLSAPEADFTVSFTDQL